MRTAATFDAITCEGPLWISTSQSAYKSRYGLLQPSVGLHIFPDSETAQTWRLGLLPSSVLLHHPYLLCPCDELGVAQSYDESLHMFQDCHPFALELSSPHLQDKVRLALPSSSHVEWKDALTGAWPVASYLLACASHEVEPDESLVREALAAPPIRTLVLENAPQSASAAVCLAALLASNRLRSLSLVNCLPDEASAQALAAGLRECTLLTDVCVAESPLGPAAGSALVSALLKCDALTRLELCDVSLAAADLAALVSRCARLETLVLERADLRDAEALLSSLPPSLQLLSLSGNRRLQPEAWQALAHCLPRALRTLRLAECGLKDWAGRLLLRGLQGSSLVVELDFERNPSLSARFVAQLLDLAEARHWAVWVDEGGGAHDEDDDNNIAGLLPDALIEDDPCRVLLRFAKPPHPPQEHVCESVALLLGLSSVTCLASSDDGMVLQLPSRALAGRLRPDEPKLALLRVQSVALLPVSDALTALAEEGLDEAPPLVLPPPKVPALRAPD